MTKPKRRASGPTIPESTRRERGTAAVVTVRLLPGWEAHEVAKVCPADRGPAPLALITTTAPTKGPPTMTINDNSAANDNNSPRWTAERWALHLRDHHPAHAAASFAKHREEMGRLAPDARVITALSMEGKCWMKSDTLPLSFDEALAKIDEACAKRAAKVAA